MFVKDSQFREILIEKWSPCSSFSDTIFNRKIWEDKEGKIHRQNNLPAIEEPGVHLYIKGNRITKIRVLYKERWKDNLAMYVGKLNKLVHWKINKNTVWVLPTDK